MYYGYEDCSQEVKNEIDLVVNICKRYLENSLMGVYLHGSLAMKCFNPDRSDVDLLVVIKDKISPEIKVELIKELMNISMKPSPIEISFLIENSLIHESPPFSYDLHYSEYWRKKYEKKVTRIAANIWRDESLKDIDLSAHIRVINERGLTIFGKDKDLVFPYVGDKEYLDAIMYDFEDGFEEYSKKPEYYILNSCRVLNFLENGYVTSKKEAGEWAIEILPKRFKALVKIALNVYIGRVSGAKFERKATKRFLGYIKNKVSESIE